MVFRNCFFLLLLIIVFVHTGYAQRQLFITPSLGMNFPLSYTISQAIGDGGYRANAFDFGASFDLSLQYQLNPKWILFGGVKASENVGFSFKYGDRQRDSFYGKLSVANYTPSIPIGFMWHLSTQKWVKLKRRSAIIENISGEKNEDILYLLLFRIRLLGGVSYSYVMPATYDNQLDSFSAGTFLKRVNDRNYFSPFLGLNFQFFNYHKNHFQLTLLYSQGFKQVIQADVNYQLLSGDYEATLGSRGSYISLQLGYPIKIYDSSKRKH
jgi:hypothetical protein